jgi:hypothetical protein
MAGEKGIYKKFAEIKVRDNLIQNEIKGIEKVIADGDDAIQKALTSIQKDISTVVSIEKAIVAQDRKVAFYIANSATSLLAFVPVWGTAASSVAKAMVGFIQKVSEPGSDTLVALASGFGSLGQSILAVGFKDSAGNTWDIGEAISYSSLGLGIGIGVSDSDRKGLGFAQNKKIKQNPGAESVRTQVQYNADGSIDGTYTGTIGGLEQLDPTTAISKAVNGSISQLAGMLTDVPALFQKQTGSSVTLLAVTEAENIYKELGDYQVAIKEGYSWIDQAGVSKGSEFNPMDPDAIATLNKSGMDGLSNKSNWNERVKSVLLPVAMYQFINSTDAGGRGNQVIGLSNVLNESGDGYGDLKSARTKAEGVLKSINSGRILHGSTRLTDELKLYKVNGSSGCAVGYSLIFFGDENRVLTTEGEKAAIPILTGIAFEKARTVAYFQDWRDKLDSGVGFAFADLITDRSAAFTDEDSWDAARPLPFYFSAEKSKEKLRERIEVIYSAISAHGNKPVPMYGFNDKASGRNLNFSPEDVRDLKAEFGNKSLHDVMLLLERDPSALTKTLQRVQKIEDDKDKDAVVAGLLTFGVGAAVVLAERAIHTKKGKVKTDFPKSGGAKGNIHWDVGWKHQRRDYFVANYAFFAILTRHLGTWNLSSLPAMGLYADSDRRVHNALIDALATFWFICSRAHGYQGAQAIDYYKGRSKVRTDDDIFRYNLPTIGFLRSPYLRGHFDVERICKQLGRKFYIDRIIVRSPGRLAALQDKAGRKTIYELSKDIFGNDLLTSSDEAFLGKPAANGVAAQTGLYVQLMPKLRVYLLDLFAQDGPWGFNKFKTINGAPVNTAATPGAATNIAAGPQLTGEIPVTDRLLLSLMPTKHVIADNYATKIVAMLDEAYYAKTRAALIADTNLPAHLQKAFLDGFNESRASLGKNFGKDGFDYDNIIDGKSRNEAAYAKILEKYGTKLDAGERLKTANDINAGYSEIVKQGFKTPKQSLVTSGQNAVTSNTTTTLSAPKDINQELANELTKLHLGAVSSIDPAESGFEQSDFNRSVLRALKLMLYKMHADKKIN